jgi:simple sugar transport system permease protein
MSASTTPVVSATLPGLRTARPRWYWPVVVLGALVVIATVRVLSGAHDIDSSGALAAAIGQAMPLVLVGLGGLWSERSGVSTSAWRA